MKYQLLINSFFNKKRKGPIIFTKSSWSNSHLAGIMRQEFKELSEGCRCGLVSRSAERSADFSEDNVSCRSPPPVPTSRVATPAGGTALTCPDKALLNALLPSDFTDTRAHFLNSVTATCFLPPFSPLSLFPLFCRSENLLPSLYIKKVIAAGLVKFIPDSYIREMHIQWP